MGKAAILLVLAAGITVSYGMLSSQETGLHTAKNQAEYEERVIAREIARTGFNVAMGTLRQHGDDLQAGVAAINGTLGYMEAENQGGFYRAHARFRSGHSVEVISTGYFGGAFVEQDYMGGATYKIEDNYQYEVSRAPLHVAECSRLNMVFLQSMAGYCSAVYMQRILPGLDELEEPEMIYAPGRNRNDESNIVERILDAGTQMNFFLAVSQNCNASYGTGQWGTNQWQTYDTENHQFNASHYNHIHYALDLEAGKLSEMQESPWAMVEQHPLNNQRWRIAWEDQNNQNWNLAPTHRHFHDWTRSLGGLKMHGYSGNGWPSVDAWGYRTLEDHGSRPDFSDQVVELWMEPASCDGGEAAGGSEDPDGEEEGGGTPPGTPVQYDPPTIPIDQIRPDHRFDDGAGCPCNNQAHKILVWHEQGGSPGRALCISQNGWNGHRNHSRDFKLCTGN